LYYKNPKRQLQSRREKISYEAAKGDDPAPASFRIIMLAKGGGFSMTSQR
jgi:hypothetical protein